MGHPQPEPRKQVHRRTNYHRAWKRQTPLKHTSQNDLIVLPTCYETRSPSRLLRREGRLLKSRQGPEEKKIDLKDISGISSSKEKNHNRILVWENVYTHCRTDGQSLMKQRWMPSYNESANICRVLSTSFRPSLFEKHHPFYQDRFSIQQYSHGATDSSSFRLQEHGGIA